MFDDKAELVLVRLGYCEARSPDGDGIPSAPGTEPNVPAPVCGAGLMLYGFAFEPLVVAANCGVVIAGAAVAAAFEPGGSVPYGFWYM